MTSDGVNPEMETATLLTPTEAAEAVGLMPWISTLVRVMAVPPLPVVTLVVPVRVPAESDVSPVGAPLHAGTTPTPPETRTWPTATPVIGPRSEEHTSELQSHAN